MNENKETIIKIIWNDKVGSKLIAASIVAMVSQIPILVLSITKKSSFKEIYKWIYADYLSQLSTLNIILITFLAFAIAYIFVYRKRSNYGVEPRIVDNSLVYKREKYIASRKFVLENGDLFSETKISINVRSISENSLSKINHRIVVNKKEEGDLKNNMIFDFLGGTRHLNGKVDHQILDLSNNIMLWNARFTPGLKFSEKAEYSYFRKLKVEQSTWELLQESLQDKGTKPFNHWEINTITQTDELNINVEFPPNYPITFYNDGLYIVKNETELAAESERLMREGGFITGLDTTSNSWKISINVKNPLLGVSYGIAWVPPHLEEIN